MTTTVPSTMIERSLATIASAATTDLSTTQSENVSVTGTTTITALGTVQAGAIRIVTFAAALTLTHNATSLILPSAANITTAAGDVATFISLGAGNWRCINYTKASGQALVAPAAGVTSVATGNGLQGGTITSTGTLSIAAPAAFSVGSYAIGLTNLTGGLATTGSSYSTIYTFNGQTGAGQTARGGTWMALGVTGGLVTTGCFTNQPFLFVRTA